MTVFCTYGDHPGFGPDRSACFSDHFTPEGEIAPIELGEALRQALVGSPPRRADDIERAWHATPRSASYVYYVSAWLVDRLVANGAILLTRPEWNARVRQMEQAYETEAEMRTAKDDFGIAT